MYITSILSRHSVTVSIFIQEKRTCNM